MCCSKDIAWTARACATAMLISQFCTQPKGMGVSQVTRAFLAELEARPTFLQEIYDAQTNDDDLNHFKIGDFMM
ncbi:Heat shock factor HSF30 [Gossypium arboreum]|uniref:Heat shock factor HSF30 n=1 Tax=Gossypium arboreum TaxID=29729 RepID=A0A0B0N1M0_GOSAR|nr:Heat shock factor HSF30 [Gossypium arboreum]